MNNRIYCPVANGWAERINKSQKIHICRQCKHTIDKGSSYVSLHISLGGNSWVSEAMCDDCYAIAFEHCPLAWLLHVADESATFITEAKR